MADPLVMHGPAGLRHTQNWLRDEKRETERLRAENARLRDALKAARVAGGNWDSVWGIVTDALGDG